MKAVGSILGAALAAVALSACSSGRCCRPDDRACRQVWVPPHCESRVLYGCVPARTHTRDLPVMDLCRKTTTEAIETTVTGPAEFPDTCERMVPTYDCDCLPVYGYRDVEDRQDRLVPVCGGHCVPVYEDVEVPDCGWTEDRCGCEQWVQTGSHVEHRLVGERMKREKVGERLVTVPAGWRQERVQITQRNERVQTGEHEATITTGTHVEQVPVWTGFRPVVTGRHVEAVQTGTRPDTVELLPWQYRGYEQEVVVAGFCATVCDNPRHHHRGIVLTTDEYREHLKAAAR